MKNLKVRKNILGERNQLIEDYFKDVSKCPTITNEEELKLAKEMKAGNIEAMQKLIKANLRFVITCAKQYVNQGVPLIDLIEAGNLGLIQACNLYDPDRGYKFISFAVWYIRREILKEIYNTSRTIRYPITFISKISKVKKAYDKFILDNNREPTEEELLELTNLTQEQYNKVLMDKSFCESIETPIKEDLTLKDLLESSENIDNDDFVTEALLQFISRLNEREAKIVKESFGIGCPQKKLKELGLELGLGPERVRQIRNSGIKKLKKFSNILRPYYEDVLYN